MAEIPSDIGTLAKKIGNFVVEGPDDIRELAELCRVFQVEAAEVMGYAEFEMYAAVRHIDANGGRRAKQVVRPLKHAVSLNLLAARRCTTAYQTFRRLFAEEMARKTSGQGRRNWDWQQK